MAPQVNGDSSPSSAFLSVRPMFPPSLPSPPQNNSLTNPPQHLTSYPVISDSIDTFKSNPYAAKSISLTTTTYNKLTTPVAPYLSKPYAYLSPYITRADSLLDSSLSTIDTKVPALKKPTSDLYADGKSIVFLPLKGKDYVLDTYHKEVKKVGGESGGVVGYGKAAVGTGFVVLGDSLGWLGGFLREKKKEGKEVVAEKTG